MSGLQGLSGTARANNFATATFTAVGAEQGPTAADLQKAKNIFRYFAQVDSNPNSNVDVMNHAITDETLALRIWETVCDARGVPANKRPVFNYQANKNLVLTDQDILAVTKRFGDLFSWERGTLSQYVSTILWHINDIHSLPRTNSADSKDNRVSWKEFVNAMACHGGPHNYLFASICPDCRVQINSPPP